jgi:long-chain acyl-CoA synthetase
MHGEFFSVDLLVAERAANSPAHAVFYTRSQKDGVWRGFTWQELASQLEEAKHVLDGAGVRRGDVLGIVLPSCVTWEIFHIACLSRGVVVVGLDYHDLGENFHHAVDLAGVSSLLTDESGLQRIDCEQHPTISSILVAALSNEHEPVIERAVVHHTPAAVHVETHVANDAEQEDLATIIFTSGSTGHPKGIGYSYSQLSLAVDSIVDAFPEIDSSKKTVCWLPLSNLFQRIVNLCALRVGAPVYFVEDPRSIMDLLPEIRPSVLIGVPRFYEKVFDNVRSKLNKMPAAVRWGLVYVMEHSGSESRLERLNRTLANLLFRSVREAFGGRVEFLISGSAPMPQWLLRNYDAFGLPVLEAYGLSENIVPLSANRFNEFKFGSVGKPMRSNDLTVADDGELLCRGPGVCKRYLGNGGAGLAIDGNGYLATGDYAEMDQDGFIWLKGRKSEIFKTNTGRRISPAEIEQYVKGSGLVDHAVVIGAGRKYLLVLVTILNDGPAKSTSAELERIRVAVADSVKPLPSYKRPGGILILCRSFTPQTGELTANLKLKRKVIEAKYQVAIDALYTAIDSDELSDGLMSQHGSNTYMGRL